MDFVTKSLAQLTELFRSMTVGARITAGLLLVMVVVSVGYLFRYQTYGGGVYLMNGEAFTQSQLNAMEAAFAQANLGNWENDGNRIRVPRSQKAAYMAALAEKGALPRNFLEILEKTVSQNNIWDDRTTRENRLRVAKQQELSAIIKAMRGIQDAAVLWDSEKASGGTSILKQVITTASVSVKPMGSTDLTGSLVGSIRNLVASSIAGLKPENVVVTDLNSGRAYRGDGENGGDPSSDGYAMRKQMYEQQYTAKLLQALSYVPRVSVVANVELDKEKLHKQRKVVHDPKTVPLQTIDKSRARSHDGAAPGGRTGFQANQPQSIQPVASTKGPHEEEDESERTEVNAISSETLERDRVGMTPTRVTVSVQVPSSYFLKVWQERNPAQPGVPAKPPAAGDLDLIRTQEITKIEKCIAPLLPVPVLDNPNPATPDTTKLVTVTEFQDITPEAIPLPGMKDNVLQWLQQYWTTLGMVLLGAISLGMLRSMARGGPAVAESPARPAATPAATAAATAAAAAAEAEAESIAERRLRRLSGGGPTLRDELSEIVKEDPDAAANILKLWIGNAS